MGITWALGSHLWYSGPYIGCKVHAYGLAAEVAVCTAGVAEARKLYAGVLQWLRV